MSGKEFVAFLSEIRFPKEVDPDSVDWMFDRYENKDFMRWLCNDITSENLITPEELSRFERLTNFGGLILDNENLEEALANQKSKTFTFVDDYLYLDDNHKRIEAIKQHIEETEQRIKSLHNQKNLLIKQRNLLESQKSTLSDKHAKLKKTTKCIVSNSQKEISSLKRNDQDYSETLNLLLPVIDNFRSYYDQFVAEMKRYSLRAEKLFLSQETFDRFYKEEAKFTIELGNYAKKLFSLGCSGDGREDFIKFLSGECLNYDFSITLHESMLDNEMSCYSFCVENEEGATLQHQEEKLLLLRKIISESETRFIHSKLEERKARAVKELLGQVLHHMRNCSSPFFPSTPSLMIELQLKREREATILENTIDEIFEESILKQIEEIASLETSRILLKNYESKCNAQKQLLQNQVQIIKQLVSQKARNEFLSLALLLELKEHKHASCLLKTISNLINDSNVQSNSRLEIVAEMLAMTRARSELVPIISKEKFLHHLNKVLSSPSSSEQQEGKLQLTMEDLRVASRHLAEKVLNKQLKKDLLYTMTEENSMMLMKQIMESLRTFPASLQRPETTVGEDQLGLAQQLLPVSIVALMTELDDLIQRVEKVVAGILRDVDKKKQVIGTDGFLVRERTLYKLFFMNVEQFRREMKHIKQKVQHL